MKNGTFALAIGAGLILAGGAGYAGYRYMKQRGIRNNNPGNLVITDIAWKGKVPKARNTDGKFEQFEDDAGVPGHIWGLRAMYMDLRGDVIKRGMNTVRKLVTAYAPPAENDTAAYVAAVAAAIGKGPDAVLTASDLLKVQAAVIQHENGVQPYPLDDLKRAAALA